MQCSVRALVKFGCFLLPIIAAPPPPMSEKVLSMAARHSAASSPAHASAWFCQLTLLLLSALPGLGWNLALHNVLQSSRKPTAV